VALAGAPVRRRRHALVVGSNPTFVRILQTYLDREGLNVSVSSLENVRRAVDELRSAGAASSIRVATPGSGPIAVVVVVFPPGSARTEVCQLLAVHEETESAPLVFVQSATVPSSVAVAKSTTSFAGMTADAGETVELVWPFRLREVFDAVAIAISTEDARVVSARLRRDDPVGREIRNLTRTSRSGRPSGADVAVAPLAVGTAGMVSA
jgi:CheY-like chemotaxis protein